MATVILDAGHGGWDNGAMYNGRKEKDDNLKLALAVGKKLEDKGVGVDYTRTQDVYDSPLEKAKIANASGADYFVSFHRNASPDNNQYSGVQTLIYNEGDVKEKLANEINKGLESVGFDNLGISVRNNLAVLKRTNIPAVLIETGFINTDKDNLIFDENFEVIAESIADSINRVINNQASSYYYTIQVGLFRNEENAKRLANELISMGYTVKIGMVNGYYAVWVGNFKDMNQAKRIERVLQEDGYETWIIAV